MAIQYLSGQTIDGVVNIGTSASRLKLEYDSATGYATVGSHSTGNTRLLLGTSISGSYFTAITILTDQTCNFSNGINITSGGLITTGFTVNGTGRITGVLTFGSSNTDFTFPTTRGTNGQILKTNGFGAVTWQNETTSGGTVTSIGTTAPLTGGTITASGTLGITQSTTSASGYLSSTDWNTFNNKTSNTGTVTSVATSNGITGGTITTSGTLSLDRPNSALGAVLATYGTTGSGARIRCTAPFNTNSGKMFSIEITIYSSYVQHNYVVSAYMYSSTNQWYDTKAIYTTTASATPDIYVGRDANGKAYISIANGSYTGVLVHNMTQGYVTSVADTYDPWTITLDNGNENSASVTTTQIWTSRNHTPGDYLPLAGGTMTGTINMNSNTITNGGDIYSNSWLRNNNSGQGLYNEATGQHWYSDGAYWNIGYNGTQGIRLRNGHNGAIMGYLYSETSGNFGLLDKDGNWTLRTDGASITELRCNDVTGFQIAASGDVTLAGNVGIGGAADANYRLLVSETTYTSGHSVANFINGYSGSRVSYDTVLICQTDVPCLSIIERYDGNQANEQKLTLAVGDHKAVIRTAGTSSGMYFNVAAAVTAPGYQSTSGINAIHISNSGNVTSSVDTRSPIFYDNNNTAYYVNPDGTSNLNAGIFAGTVAVNAQNAISLKGQIDLPSGSTSSAGSIPAYSIYQTAGAWTYPYPDLNIAMHTGIRLGANSSYQGIRFYNDYNMVTQVMSVNNASDGLGAGNVYINDKLQVGTDVRAPIYYDVNNTAYYVDPASMSQMGYIDFNGIVTGTNSGAAQVGRNHAYDTLELKGYGAEFMIGAQNTTLHINYRTCNNGAGGHTPTTWFWRNGTSTGWSDHNFGRVTSASDMRAPIYYDSSNTTYYTRPGTSSLINSLYTHGLIQAGQSGSGDVYIGGTSSNYFRFHLNNADSYFDMNCGNIYWRQGASTRYYFYTTTANMTINGSLTQNSDERVKENIVEISDCIDKVKAIRGVYYNRTDFNTEVKKVGVIAQEVEKVLPEVILEAPDTGFKSVAYAELTSILVNAIKEQQVIIDDLKTRIETLENN